LTVDKRLGFQAGAPAKEHHISSIGHPVSVDTSHVMLVVSRLHQLSASHLAGTIQSHSEAQQCKTIGRPCSATYVQGNHICGRTGNWSMEYEVG
jgi:hypothetical protein